jgi:hypothetical protein
VSDFLVNLARRSAGLAPVVRARSSLPAIASEAPSEAPVSSAAWHAAATTPVRIIQRAPVASPAAPVVSPAPALRAVNVPPVSPRTQSAAETVTRETAVVHLTTPALPVSQPEPQPRERHDAIAPAIVPAAIASIDPVDEKHHDEPRHEIMSETLLVNERVIEPAARAAPEPVVMTIRPASRPVHVTTASRAETNPERTVNVRIGAIEIYGPDEGADTPKLPPSTPAAVAPSTTAASPGGGFDDYAALRSYAPWAW